MPTPYQTGNTATGKGLYGSGNTVDGQTVNYWGGAAAPDSTKTQVGAAAQSAGVNSIDPNANRYNQGLAAQYAAQAAGQGPSLAQQQQQRATEENARAQAAMAGGGRNAALGQFNAAQNAAAASQQGAGQSAMARLAEQYQAQQGLQGVTGQMQNAYGTNAQMAQQNNQFNTGNQIGNQQLQANLNSQATQNYNAMMASQQSQYNQYQQQHDLSQQQANNQLRNESVGKAEDFVGGALSGVSDEKEKKEVQSGGGALQAFLDKMKAMRAGQPAAGADANAGTGTGKQSMVDAGRGFAKNLMGVQNNGPATLSEHYGTGESFVPVVRAPTLPPGHGVEGTSFGDFSRSKWPNPSDLPYNPQARSGEAAPIVKAPAAGYTDWASYPTLAEQLNGRLQREMAAPIDRQSAQGDRDVVSADQLRSMTGGNSDLARNDRIGMSDAQLHSIGGADDVRSAFAPSQQILASGLSGYNKPGAEALAALSDKNEKTGIRAGGTSTDTFLGRLKAHEYKYKHPDMPGAGDGTHFSVMAQELDKAGPVGKSMVKETPNGKMVDYSKGFAAMLAAQADLHGRVKALEHGGRR